MPRKTTHKTQTRTRPKPRAVKAFSPPSKVEERRFRAESLAMDEFRGSPEFKKATKAAETGIKAAEAAAKKAIRGK